MPRDGSGNYSLPAGNPFITGTVISSVTMNNTMADIATALTNSATLNGSASQPFSASTLTAATDATVPSLNGGQLAGFRNRIINGDMRIDQRNNGSSVTVATTTATYAVDRFVSYKATAGATVTAQQQAASLTGFEKCIVYNVSVGSAPAAGDINAMWQCIEGVSLQDLQFGTANAKTVTVSFWAKQSVAGTYGFSLHNSNVTQSYVQTYTIASPNVWQYFSFTIIGDTTGTWARDNTIGIYVSFDCGSGTNYEITAGTWVGGNYKRTSACAKPIQAASILSITGVQLEVGSIATPFEQRPYGTELALCQRYYYRNFPIYGGTFGACFSYVTNTYGYSALPFPVPMRVAPSALEQDGTASHYSIGFAGAVTACSTVPIHNGASTVNVAFIQWNATSGHTAGQAGFLYSSNAAAYLGWSAEL